MKMYNKCKEFWKNC